MADKKELVDFRQIWIREIKDVPIDHVKPLPESSTDNISKKRQAAEEENSASGLSHGNSGQDGKCQSEKTTTKRKNQFQPFLIAEKLLEGQSGKQSLEFEKFNFNLSPSSQQQGKSVNIPEEEFDFQRNKRLRLSSGSQKKSGQQDSLQKEDSFLDIFIADLDDINEIPFFDLQIPREVAMKMFRDLDAVDLCHCAQVSRAWKSLAEDELLWCQISHQLGYEQDLQTLHKSNWKQVVHDHVLQERQLQTNWRMRTGEMTELQYVRGGVLCAATSCDQLVAAGFSTGDVRLWDLAEDESCTLQPSNTALRLNEEDDMGTTANYVTHVACSETHTAAAYHHGNVDIWTNTGKTTAVHTFECTKPGVSHLLCASSAPVWAASHGSHVTVHGSMDDRGGGIQLVQDVDLETEVTGLLLLPNTRRSPLDQVLVVALHDEVRVHKVGDEPGHMTSLHHAVSQLVTCLDGTEERVALGLDLQDDYQVRLHCVRTGRETATLEGFTWRVTAISFRDSPPNTLVTGCGDRRVRVFDTRLAEPVVVFQGHTSPVACVQMDDWKVVSGAEDGRVCVWDQRMGTKLWDLHNRHPVKYVKFKDHRLVTANVPNDMFPENDGLDSMLPRRLRGSLNTYDFSQSQQTEGLPSNFFSTYDEPEGYSYSINLTTPYDNI